MDFRKLLVFIGHTGLVNFYLSNEQAWIEQGDADIDDAIFVEFMGGFADGVAA